MHYNTNNLTGNQLKTAHKRATSVKQLVLNAFTTIKKPMAYFEVINAIGGIGIPESSVKRSLSDLKNEGVLEITNNMVNSVWNTPCHRYKLV